MAHQAHANFSLETPTGSTEDLAIPGENSLLVCHAARNQMPWCRITFAGLVAPHHTMPPQPRMTEGPAFTSKV